nr:unnamed protein product [Callosobruchus analis]
MPPKRKGATAVETENGTKDDVEMNGAVAEKKAKAAGRKGKSEEDQQRTREVRSRAAKLHKEYANNEDEDGNIKGKKKKAEKKTKDARPKKSAEKKKGKGKAKTDEEKSEPPSKKAKSEESEEDSEQEPAEEPEDVEMNGDSKPASKKDSAKKPAKEKKAAKGKGKTKNVDEEEPDEEAEAGDEEENGESKPAAKKSNAKKAAQEKKGRKAKVPENVEAPKRTREEKPRAAKRNTEPSLEEDEVAVPEKKQKSAGKAKRKATKDAEVEDSEETEEAIANSVYEFKAKDINGTEVSLDRYKGHVCIIVNVASRCGHTKSNYEQFVEIYDKYSEDKGLKILAFPCNQFGKQEPGDAQKILDFVAKRNVKFDMFEKIEVNGKNAPPLWKYLKSQIAGPKGHNIDWNFTKFIIDKEGNVVERHKPSVKPLQLVDSLEKYWYRVLSLCKRPVCRGLAEATGAATKMSNPENYKDANSIYEFTCKDIKGNDVSLEKYRGHVCIIVNVASQCGYTKNHYAELGELYDQYADSKGLRILAFPCNQFANEEPGTSEEICQFVQTKNVKFDMFEKVNVNGSDAHPLWKYLKHKQGGTLGDFIKWNFTKFIIDKDGQPVERHGPSTSPKDLVKNLENDNIVFSARKMTNPTDYKNAKSIYEFTVNDNRGNLVSLDKYEGHVCIIINVASHCALAKINYPELNELFEQYGESKGLKVLGEDISDVKGCLRISLSGFVQFSFSFFPMLCSNIRRLTGIAGLCSLSLSLITSVVASDYCTAKADSCSAEGSCPKMSNPTDFKNAKSIYEFTANDIKGNPVSLEKYKGHVAIIVNVASNCGYTKNNYAELNELYDLYADSKGLRILAFPCNQFAGQEPGTNEEICEFTRNKGVKFDVFEKINVNGDDAHPLWKYLKHKQGGTLGDFIKWNFTKFIIDKNGQPVERHGPSTSPKELVKSLEKYW